MAGLSANSPFYNVTTLLSMLVGRYALTALALAVAGCLARQRCRPMTMGTLSADSFAFGALVAATALVWTGLSYLPALMLGPILEHFTR